MVDKKNGLSRAQAQKRLMQDGPNSLKKEKQKSRAAIFLEQLQDPLIYVLLAAAAVSVLLKEYSDAGIIAVVVIMNAVIGSIQEGKAQKALEALRNLTTPKATVIREGVRYEIPAKELVRGDLVCLEAGSCVPADLELCETVNLRIEESALTGEAVPAEKDAEFADMQKGLALGDRKNMAYMSTIVTNGRGKGIVTAVGMQTELGKIADMIHGSKEEMTPLQKRLGDLGKVLSILSLLLCAALFGIAVWQKRDAVQMLITAISLAVAAVPEGLPAVVTICLALSVTRMVKANTIVRRLPSVETLGAVNVVCSDKTGTLTQNHMTVEMGYWDGQIEPLEDMGKGKMPPKELLWGFVLCNDAQLGDAHLKKDAGDPTELALLEFGRKYGISAEKLVGEFPRIGEIPFDSESKQMTTYHKGLGKYMGFRKGAPDRILDQCKNVLVAGKRQRMDSNRKKEVQDAIQTLSGRAYRVLALAMQETEGADEWIFLGLAAMCDPVRPQVTQAVQALKKAGVATVMITGDYVRTALAVGKQIGLAENERQCITGIMLDALSDEELCNRIDNYRIFARVSPGQKVRIVKAFQKSGKIVAMTGDGVNDAPSLKSADIGIAMGEKGTDVARQASDMILMDDHFATIEKAIEEGREIYENIRKSVIFLLSSNLGELLTMFAAVLAGFASPLKSSHILWINLITDSLPALALGVDKNDRKELMRHSPRRADESLFSRGGLGCTCFYGFLIASISLAAFCLPVFPALRETGEGTDILQLLHDLLEQPEVLRRAQTYAFTVLGMSQLFHALGMRDVGKSVFGKKQLENPLMILAFAAGVLLQVAVTEIPFLVKAFGTASLDLREWGIMLLLAAMPLAAHEVMVGFTFLTAKEKPN